MEHKSIAQTSIQYYGLTELISSKEEMCIRDSRKPFGAAELRAKVAAHLRRERRPRSHALSFGEVRIDLGARGLAVGGEAVPLTPTEYAICEYLARHPGQVMSRAQIREAVLGWESDADDAAISMQVSRARRKLSEAGADVYKRQVINLPNHFFLLPGFFARFYQGAE